MPSEPVRAGAIARPWQLRCTDGPRNGPRVWWRQASYPAQLFAGIHLEPLYEGIEALAARAELVHVKSHYVGDDGTVGVIDLPRALRILESHGLRRSAHRRIRGQWWRPLAEERPRA